MIVRRLGHVGLDTSFSGFSGISARKGGLSTAIEGGVPEHTPPVDAEWPRAGRGGAPLRAA